MVDKELILTMILGALIGFSSQLIIGSLLPAIILTAIICLPMGAYLPDYLRNKGKERNKKG